MKPTRPFRIAATAISASIPILYMVGMHIYWMAGDVNAQLRMLMKHVGFWAGFAATIYTTHRFGFRAKSIASAIPIYAGAALFPIVGYEVFRRLSKRIFPKKPVAKPEEPPQQPMDFASLLQAMQQEAPQPKPMEQQKPQVSQYSYTYPAAQQYASWGAAGTPYPAYAGYGNGYAASSWNSYSPYYSTWR